MGGMLWGMSQALLEGNPWIRGTGPLGGRQPRRLPVPVNADAPDVDVEFVEVQDDVVNPLGVKGVGEIGQVGAAAAIANAVFHATGRRVRQLPMAAGARDGSDRHWYDGRMTRHAARPAAVYAITKSAAASCRATVAASRSRPAAAVWAWLD